MSLITLVGVILVIVGLSSGLSVGDESKERESLPLTRYLYPEEKSINLRDYKDASSRNQRDSQDGFPRHHTRGFFDGVVSTLKNFWMNNKETISDLAKYGILAGRQVGDNIKETND